eukprot:SAG31_NODE_3244_length_4500_cov_2.174960_2_plen_146_part_00
MRAILRQVRAVRKVTFIHVKGHSTDGGNDRADELAWWGKEEGPFSRLARDGSGEGDGIWREEPDFEERRQRRLAAAAGSTDRRETMVTPVAQDEQLAETTRVDNEGLELPTNRVDGDGYAIFDSRVFGMAGGLVGWAEVASTSQI